LLLIVPTEVELMPHRPPKRQVPISQDKIKAAYEAVRTLVSQTKIKRKRVDNADGRPAKRRRGAVEDASRIANEEILRGLFFNRRKAKVDVYIIVDEDEA
jgi:hypothetical protein